VDINILAEHTTSALWTEIDWYYWNWCNWLQYFILQYNFFFCGVSKLW